jgi:hypothetical protein
VNKNKKTYAILENAALPTEQQKENMLDHILSECRKHDATPAGRAIRLISEYPWRFAFALSAVQAALCTIIWGTGYTNMILRILGG